MNWMRIEKGYVNTSKFVKVVAEPTGGFKEQPFGLKGYYKDGDSDWIMLFKTEDEALCYFEDFLEKQDELEEL